MSKTITDVVVTQYRAEFRAEPFASYRSWHVSGGMQSRQILTRRRRWTVANEFGGVSSSDLARKRQSESGAWQGYVHESVLIDPDATILFIPDNPGSRFGTAVLVEEVRR